MKSEDLTPVRIKEQGEVSPVPTIKERLVTGTVQNFLATAFNQGSMLIVSILVARFLMKEGFGEYAMVYTTLLTMATLGQLASGYTATKYIAEYRSLDPEKSCRIMGICAIISLAMASMATITLILMAHWLAAVVLKAPQLSLALIVGSGFVFFFALNGYQIGVMTGLEAYSSLAKAGAISGVVTIIATSLGAWTGGLNGAIVGLSASASIRYFFYYKWLRIESRANGIFPLYRFSLNKEKAIILRFALPSTIAGLYMTPMIWLANSFLVRQPGGFGEMAIYSAANNLRLLVLFIPLVMNSVGLSVLNNEMAKGNESHYYRIFKNNVLYIFLVSMTGVLFVGFFGRQILWFFGKDFIAGYFLLWLLLAASFFECLSMALYQFIQSQAKIWHSLFCITIPREGCFVLMAYYLVKYNGGLGLASAFLGSIFLGLILQSVLFIALRKCSLRFLYYNFLAKSGSHQKA